MPRFIALLRGANVGGNNKISMPALKEGFEAIGFERVVTYINSGNIIFDSDGFDCVALQKATEEMIAERFSLNITVGVIASKSLNEALLNAPGWWGSDEGSKHNAIFVIPPATSEWVIGEVGKSKPEYEQVGFYGQVIFWSAPLTTFSRTRWSKIVQNKAAYSLVTIRNANTAKKLAML